MIVRRSWQRKITMLLVVLMTVLMSLPLDAHADSGDGNGSGSGNGSGGGGGPAVPLYMDWSYPRDGETGISLNPIIQCKFSHNVAHIQVQKRNKTLFSLSKEDGTDVPVRTFTVDAQIEFDKRQYIYLSPNDPLEENTKYIVTVKEGVQAKNGMATDKEHRFSFMTGSSQYSVPVLVEHETKGTVEEQGTGAAASEKKEPAGEQKSSGNLADSTQNASRPEVQQKDATPMPAQAEEAAPKAPELAPPEQDPVPQTQPESVPDHTEQVTKGQEGVSSRIAWMFLSAIMLLALIFSTAIRKKWGGSPKLPPLILTEPKDRYIRR